MPREQWTRDESNTWGLVGGSDEVPEYCPGYTTRLPIVQDVARLWGWEKRGSIEMHLRARGIEPWPVLLDYLDIFAGNWARAEAWEMDERAKGSKR